MKILVVDDDPMIIELLSMRLKAEGYEVSTAFDGWGALRQLSTSEFDFLIMDLMMPEVSGVTLLSLLRSYVFGKMPVIVISSLDQASVVLKEIGIRADDFFIKPVNTTLLVQRIRKLTSQTV